MLALLACQSPPATPIPPKGDEVCANLAYVFLLIAEERDRGISRKAQIEMVRESVENPFVTRPDQALRDLLHVVDLVYRHPDASAREIEASVLAACVVDERGRAVLAAFSPTR